MGSKKCSCGKVLHQDEMALNIKMFGKNPKQYLCLDCMSAFLEQPVEKLHKIIHDFRKAGCLLFK